MDQILHGKKQITKNSLSVRRYKRSKIVGLILIVISLFGWTVYFLERNNYLETTFVYHRSIINESIFPNRYRSPRPPSPPRPPQYSQPERLSRSGKYINIDRIDESGFNLSLILLGFIGLIGIFILGKSKFIYRPEFQTQDSSLK